MKKSKKLLSILLSLALILCILPATAFALDDNETDIINVPCVTRVTPTTIQVKAVANVEYRIGTGDWSTATVFTGLYPNTTYEVSYRINGGTAVSLGTQTTPQAEYITNNSSTIDSVATTLAGVNIKHNVAFQDYFGLYYYIPVNELSGYTNCRLFIQRKTFAEGASTCTYNNSVVPISSLSKTTQAGTGVLRYTYLYKNIAAAQLGENVYVSIYAEKDGITYITPVDDYSIKKYAYNNLKDTSSASAGLKAMLVDVLNYGAAAQVYFDRDKNHLVNADLTTSQQALANSTSASSLVNCKSSSGEGVATITSNNVSFGNAAELIYYVTFPAGYSLNNVVLEATYVSSNSKVGTVTKTIPGSSFVWDESKNRYNVVLSGVATTDYGCPITAVIKNNGTVISNTRVYNIESYCANNSSSTSVSQGLKDLMLALMRYSYSARSYFGS